VQIKRIHEYKRQLLNILYTIHRYLQIKDTPAAERKQKFVPRVVMIGGKAAPGYYTAKVIIELINRVSMLVNQDAEVGDLLKVVFLPNYCVSAAQIIIPASELSQHISTAGTEASGTSNRKFIMNGCLSLGTMDGANVEIAEEVGQENMFVFGMDVAQVNAEGAKMRGGFRDYVDPLLARVFDTIRSGLFGGDTNAFKNLINNLCNGGDHYLVSHDFNSYKEAQTKVDEAYKDQKRWNAMAIENVARSGKFSSDRTIRDYCEEIWKVDPVSIPHPSKDPKTRVRSFANLPIDQ
jgi:starch phosphorylase